MLCSSKAAGLPAAQVLCSHPIETQRGPQKSLLDSTDLNFHCSWSQLLRIEEGDTLVDPLQVLLIHILKKIWGYLKFGLCSGSVNCSWWWPSFFIWKTKREARDSLIWNSVGEFTYIKKSDQYFPKVRCYLSEKIF